MKTAEEIKEELDSINSYINTNIYSALMSGLAGNAILKEEGAQLMGKIKALEWVLEDSNKGEE